MARIFVFNWREFLKNNLIIQISARTRRYSHYGSSWRIARFFAKCEGENSTEEGKQGICKIERARAFLVVPLNANTVFGSYPVNNRTNRTKGGKSISSVEWKDATDRKIVSIGLRVRSIQLRTWHKGRTKEVKVPLLSFHRSPLCANPSNFFRGSQRFDSAETSTLGFARADFNACLSIPLFFSLSLPVLFSLYTITPQFAAKRPSNLLTVPPRLDIVH